MILYLLRHYNVYILWSYDLLRHYNVYILWSYSLPIVCLSVLVLNMAYRLQIRPMNCIIGFKTNLSYSTLTKIMFLYILG